MVYGTYNELINGVYKATDTTGVLHQLVNHRTEWASFSIAMWNYQMFLPKEDGNW
jgi:hypothetical protein